MFYFQHSEVGKREINPPVRLYMVDFWKFRERKLEYETLTRRLRLWFKYNRNIYSFIKNLYVSKTVS